MECVDLPCMLPSCRICRFYCEPSNPKKVRGTLKGPCCRPMVGAPNLDLVSYLYERWSAQAKNHSVVGSPIEQRLIICAIYAFFERATKCHQTKIFLYALGVHFVHVLYSVIFNRISAIVLGETTKKKSLLRGSGSDIGYPT